MQIRRKYTQNEFKMPCCKYVIIDTDAGGDDAQCILLALAEAKRTNKTILGITCVNGNATVQDVAVNVLITLTIANSKIPVYKGSPTNTTGQDFKDDYFGADGFGLKQKELKEKLVEENRWDDNQIQKQNAIQFLVESANKYAGDLAIIAIGPLTNLSLAYHLDNSIALKVPLLSVMGGSISSFGIRSFFAAEFNFHLDTQAAYVVMEVFPLVVISSFDLALDLGTDKTINLFLDRTRPKAKLINDIHGVILSTHKPSLCDPLACIPVFSPEIITGIYKAYGRIEMGGNRTSGLLSLDWFKEDVKGKEKIWAISDIDAEKLVKSVDESYN